MTSIDGAISTPFLMDVIVQSRVEAYIYVIESDRIKTLYVDEEFTVEGRYIVGDPKIADIPFVINTYPVGEFPFPNIDILSVDPVNPNTHNAGASTEQIVIATAIARSVDSDVNAGLSPSQGTKVRFELEMFQPDLKDAVTARHSGTDGVVPNVSSQNIGGVQRITWDNPVEDGEEIGVDARVNIHSLDSEGNKTRIGNDDKTFDVDERVFNLDYYYLDSIVQASGGTMSRTQPAIVVVRLKPDSDAHIFNRDGSIDLNLFYPFTARYLPRRFFSDAITVDLVEKTRLGGATYLALEFYAVARRAEDIDHFEYRIRRWTQFPDATPDNPFPDPEDFPFSEWADVPIRTTSRFIDENGDDTRDDVERDSTNTYLGPYGFHADASPGLLAYDTQYIVEARTVNIVYPNADVQKGSIRTFNVVLRS